ncbi:MAG TPA: methionyl-tRNA formyltransferase [Oligoflexia bacterium]|nr:methionyl-tRNA formyltransferase [Oligoflexia bacterium]HMR24466.1 methionyl-tRNA formyltransferase [Oligoflexia bacterium]
MHPKTQRIVFFGTPDFAVPCLQAIIESGRDIVQVITQPDKPKGRGKQLAAPAIKVYCQQQNIPYLQPKKIKTEAFYTQLEQFKADIFVVVAFGRIFTSRHLSICPYTLNVHASLLPKWRGASPIQRSLQYGDQQTGISIMQLVEELDAGDVMYQAAIDIGPNMRFEDLSQQLSSLGAESIVKALDLIDQDKAHFEQQNHAQASFCPPIKVEEAQINWKKPSLDIHNLIRAFHLWPGAFCSDGQNRIKILHSQLSDPPEHLLTQNNYTGGQLIYGKKQLWVKTADAWLEILEVQMPGKKQVPIQAFLAGYKNKNIDRWQ